MCNILKYFLLLVATHALNLAMGQEMDFTPAEEVQLDLLDKHFTKEEKQKKMLVCFDLSQKEFVEKRNTYQKLANTLAGEKGLNVNDALRALFHETLVACYFNAQKNDIEAGILGKLVDEDKIRLFTLTNSTPKRFSNTQLQILESIITATNKKTSNILSGSFLNYFTGLYGYIYFFCIILLISLGFYYAITSLRKLQERETKTNKKKQK
ncbi:hypothetical protein cand_006350 [Cryptosporidium andersoni]|uniref:Uncharacterized protein n=1 Tax=Cryptosporidium andersoni TaxID=117008 RepID=A0A1J4MTL9_9CRYT|nr:hypothetical protein cand_006350 [Cryptosporidium andersoni]